MVDRAAQDRFVGPCLLQMYQPLTRHEAVLTRAAEWAWTGLRSTFDLALGAAVLRPG